MNWILASGSPRRADILGLLGIECAIHVPDVDEVLHPGEAPESYVLRMSRDKAGSVGERFSDVWVIAGDTAVVVDGEVLGKPVSETDAVDMLLRLQGRDHLVASALTLLRPARKLDALDREPEPSPRERAISGVDVTDVRFRTFDRGVAEAYVRTGEPMDKAGAYGIQGRGAALVERIRGDYTGVVGLPVSLLVQLMAEAGCPYLFGEPTAPID